MPHDKNIDFFGLFSVWGIHMWKRKKKENPNAATMCVCFNLNLHFLSLLI